MRWSSVLIVLTVLAPSALARKLPKHRPADFSISYVESGGMRGGGEHATIAAAGTYDNSTPDLNDPLGGKVTHATFTMTDTELDRLYAKLRKAGADRIRYTKHTIYDRGGVSITINAGGHTWDLDDAGGSVVIERDRKRFDKVLGIVTAVIAAKVPASAPATQ